MPEYGALELMSVFEWSRMSSRVDKVSSLIHSAIQSYCKIYPRHNFQIALNRRKGFSSPDFLWKTTSRTGHVGWNMWRAWFVRIFLNRKFSSQISSFRILRSWTWDGGHLISRFFFFSLLHISEAFPAYISYPWSNIAIRRSFIFLVLDYAAWGHTVPIVLAVSKLPSCKVCKFNPSTVPLPQCLRLYVMQLCQRHSCNCQVKENESSGYAGE